MAFNPLDAFRRYSKWVFGLMILCMFIFVLSSGLGSGGDFFDWLPRQVGEGRGGKQVLAEAFGDKITLAEIEHIKGQRELANRFMTAAVPRAHFTLVDQLSQEVARLKEPTAMLARGILEAKRLLIAPRSEMDALIGQWRYSEAISGEADMLNTGYGRLRAELNRLARDKERNQAEYALLGQLLRIVDFDRTRIARAQQLGRGAAELYFAEEPLTTRGAVEFAVLLREADKLGVRYTDEYVQKLVNDEMLGGLRSSDAGEIEAGLKKMYREGKRTVSSEEIAVALANEFRVRTVRTTLFGDRARAGGTLTDMPAYVTPFEFFQFYKEHCTSINVGVVEPTDAFYAKVTEQPTESQLKDLYAKYHRETPDPGRETPGFREPRRVRLQWISVGQDLPTYKKNLPAVQVSSIVGIAASGLNGGGIFGPALPAVVPVADDSARLGEDYKRYLERRLRWSNWMSPELRDTSAFHPAVIAATAAAGAGVFGTQASAWALPSTTLNLTTAIEVRDRVRVGAQIALNPLFAPPPGVLPFGLSTALNLTAVGPTAASLPKDLPFEAVRRVLAQRHSREAVERFMHADLEKFQVKLRDLAKDLKPDDETKRTEVRAFVDGWLKARPEIKSGTAAEARDMFTMKYLTGKAADANSLPPLELDPAMESLHRAFQMALVDWRRGQPGQQEPLFGIEFFRDARLPDGKRAPTLYQTYWFPAWSRTSEPPFFARDGYLAWAIEDREARPVKYEDARKELEKVWRLRKARDLAKARAEEVAKELAKQGPSPDLLRQFGKDQGLVQFELGPIAKLLEKKEEFRLGSPDAYVNYKVPNELIAHPTADLVKQLLDLGEKKVGETIVLHDEPRAKYYAVKLLRKDEVSEDKFALIYGRSSSPIAGLRDPLYQMFAKREAERAFAKAAFDRLKAEAKYVEQTDEIDKRSSERSDAE